jgi:hypothetical protein
MVVQPEFKAIELVFNYLESSLLFGVVSVYMFLILSLLGIFNI